MSKCSAKTCKETATQILTIDIVGDRPGELDKIVLRYDVLFCDTHTDQFEGHSTSKNRLQNI